MSGLRRRASVAAAVLLAVTAGALIVVLTAAVSTHAASDELSRRLVPAAGATGVLLGYYTAQQNSLRDYVTTERPAALASYHAAAEQIPAQEAGVTGLVRGYQRMPGELAAAISAQRAWLANVAAPQLAAAARGDFARARAMQANVTGTRPYVLAVSSHIADLQAQITGQQQAVTDRVVRLVNILIAALIAMCVLVGVIAAGGVIAVRRWLLTPVSALRSAAEDVAAGRYDTHIPAVGPAELAQLGRSTDLMRTRLVAALADREQAEQRFRHLFESSPDATLAVATDGSIAMVNAQAERMFGYPAAELVGQQVEMLVPQAARAAHPAHRADYFADPQARPMGAGLQLSALRSDGSEFPVEIRLSALPTEGGLVISAAVRDVSQRLAAEAERDRLRAEAERERMERRLQQSQRLESLGQLVGGVAHDFNNMLNIIQGYTDFVADQVTIVSEADKRLEPVLADIEQVRVAAQQAARLTRQLLTFARHDRTRPEILDLNSVVMAVEQLLRRTLGEHIDLIIVVGDGLWPTLADRSQLEQVLVNLAVNARDAMPGGGRLTIDTGNADIDASYAASRPGLSPGRYIRLRVSDTGTGMDRATLDRVFEPFYTTKPKGHGTGLGLATVYGVVTQAGGSIQIYSEPGLGTTVTVLLPASEAAPAPGPAPAQPGARGGNDETILLVEDEDSLRLLTSRILTRNGYQVCTATTASDAVHLAGDSSQVIDLLLTDVIMPEMLGNEVAARVHAARPEVPVLYMSGYAQTVLDTHGALDPQIEIVEKPFTESTLLARVRQAIDHSHQVT